MPSRRYWGAVGEACSSGVARSGSAVLGALGGWIGGAGFCLGSRGGARVSGGRVTEVQCVRSWVGFRGLGVCSFDGADVRAAGLFGVGNPGLGITRWAYPGGEFTPVSDRSCTTAGGPLTQAPGLLKQGCEVLRALRVDGSGARYGVGEAVRAAKRLRAKGEGRRARGEGRGARCGVALGRASSEFGYGAACPSWWCRTPGSLPWVVGFGPCVTCWRCWWVGCIRPGLPGCAWSPTASALRPASPVPEARAAASCG